MIALDSISISYGSRVILDNASAAIPKGTLCALIGVNGAGKSTLLRRIAGLEKGYDGEIRIAGKNIRNMPAKELASLVSLVTTQRVRVGNLTCREVVALGRAPYTNWIGSLSPEDKAAMETAMIQAGVSEFANRGIATLSDGEAQRVMIARAIAQDTPVILLDEPTSFLDLPNRYRLADLLMSLCRENGKTILFSTHELDIASTKTDLTWIIDTPALLTARSETLVSDGIIKRVFGL